MSQASSQAHAFYKEVAQKKVVWTIKDEGGYPAPMTSEKKRAQPFWSSASRATKIVREVKVYSGFEVVSITWDVFKEKWATGLSKDGLLAGVNWSGKNAQGYDLDPKLLVEYVERLIQ